MRVVYTDEALIDLVDIGTYTWTRWGERQFERYSAGLAEFCEQTLPTMRHPIGVEGRPGLYRSRFEHHFVYFRHEDGRLKITRILHERMLPERHL